MKKLFTLFVAAMLTLSLFSLAACGNDNDSADERPVIKVGMECGYQPYNWTQFTNANNAVAIKGKTGQYAYGFDVMVAQKIADELDMKLEIYAYEWESLVPAVQSGALDFIIAGMSPTADRKQKVDFSEPYYESNLVVVVKKDGAFASATNLEGLTGAKIVAQSGTFHDEVVEQIPSVTHVTAMEDFPTMIVALNSGSIDGYIAEEPGAIADCNANSSFTYIHLANNDTGFTVTDMSNVTLAVGLKKNSELLSKVNAALAKLTAAQRQEMMNTAISLAARLGV